MFESQAWLAPADTPCSNSLRKWAHLPSWKSIYKMLVFFLVPTLRGWGQLRVSVTPYNNWESLGEQARLLVPFSLFPPVRCLGFPVQRRLGDREKEERKNSGLWQLGLFSQVKGQCYSLGEMLSKWKHLHVPTLTIWRCQPLGTEVPVLSSSTAWWSSAELGHVRRTWFASCLFTFPAVKPLASSPLCALDFPSVKQEWREGLPHHEWKRS